MRFVVVCLLGCQRSGLAAETPRSNLKNLNKTWVDQNASLVLAGIRYPFVFYYDFLENTILQEAAYCLQVGQSKGVSINTNHLYSLPIKTVARSWS